MSGGGGYSEMIDTDAFAHFSSAKGTYGRVVHESRYQSKACFLTNWTGLDHLVNELARQRSLRKYFIE